MPTDTKMPPSPAPEPAPPPGLTSAQLLPLVYEKLRRLATTRMFRESGLQTLQPTALAHEAWLRLAHSRPAWESQAHFLGAAAGAMRRILVDRARAKAALKRQLPQDPAPAPHPGTHEHQHILLIHEALTRLEAEDPAAAHIVMLKFFSGSTTGEIAAMRGQSPRAIERQWTFARARLYQIIQDDLARP